MKKVQIVYFSTLCNLFRYLQEADCPNKYLSYVDDGLLSVETKEEAIVLYQQLQQLFQKGAFKLHKCDSNSPEVLNAIPKEIRSVTATANLPESDNFTKTLGIDYNSQQDQFRFSVANFPTEETELTKRLILSDSAKIFDPLDLVSCVTIVVKIIFERLWELIFLPPWQLEEVLLDFRLLVAK